MSSKLPSIIALFFLLQFCSLEHLFGQPKRIFGKVHDSKTAEALPSVNVFFNNTTIGTTTDEKGEFKISLLTDPLGELVFSFVGYETQKVKIGKLESDKDVGTIRLIPSEKELNSIVVSSSRDKKWEKDLKRFKRAFIGNDRFSEACSIENPWVIDFPASKNSGELLAKATSPIEINNYALGYKVFFDLSNFWIGRNGYAIQGNVQFLELKGNSDNEIDKWNANRRKSYARSTQHLFKAIVDGRIRGEGFGLYKGPNGFENSKVRSPFFFEELGKSIVPYDSSEMVVELVKDRLYKILLNGNLEIHYYKDGPQVSVYRDLFACVSWIDAPKGYVIVNKNGHLENPTDLFISGDMSKDRVARMLPIDYEPSDNNTETIDFLLYQEQIYIHADKPYYYPGETIWLKGYINYGYPAWRDSLSRTVYLELISKNWQSIILEKIVRADSGFFYNDFTLPDTITNGIYYLRAYTNLNRNFNDSSLYQKVIPVLNVSHSLKSVTDFNLITQENLTIISSKRSFITREKIKITFFTQDKEKTPIASNFSVSVTDAKTATSLDFPDIITQYPIRRAQFCKSNFVFPKEHGISFLGKITDHKNHPITGILNLIQFKPRNLTLISSDEKGFFSASNLLFYDTGKFTIQNPLSSREELFSVEYIKRKPPRIQLKESELNFEKKWNEFILKSLDTVSLVGTKVLNQIEVKAKRIVVEKQVDRVERPYGRPDYVLTEKDINASYGNLLMTLPGKFPGLVVRQNPFGEWLVYTTRSGTGSFLFPKQVLVTVNNAIMTGSPGNILSAIDPSTIKSIEFTKRINVLYGAQGSSGVLSIYTKNVFEGLEQKKGISILNIPGYSTPQVFQPPIYDSKDIENQGIFRRSTIYWNPVVKTESITGLATISFIAPDRKGTYKIEAEGVNKDGDPIRYISFIEVK